MSKSLYRRFLFFYFPLRWILYFFLQVEVYGTHHIETLKKEGVIFAANHISYLDSPLLVSSLPKKFKHFFPIRFIGADEYFHKMGFREIFRFFGVLPAKKGNGHLARSLGWLLLALERGGSVGIFPEGARSQEGDQRLGTAKICQGKRGIGFLAKFSQKAIVPVGIVGVFQTSVKDFFLRRRKAVLIFGEPFIIDQYHSVEDAAAYVMDEITKLVSEGEKRSQKNII